MIREDADRLAALEAILVQLLAEKFASQLIPLRGLQTFGDRVHDLAGRNESLQSLLDQVNRRRQHIEATRRIR